MPALPAVASIEDRLLFRRSPLAAAAVCLGLGILLARFVYQPILVVLVDFALLALLGAIALVLGLRRAWVPVLAAWLILGFAAGTWRPAPPPTDKLVGYADNLSRTVRGHVVRVRTLSPPPRSEADADQIPPWEATELEESARGPALSVDLGVDEIEDVSPERSRMVPVNGGVRVSIFSSTTLPRLRCGDEVELPLRLKLPDRFRDPGAFQYADYLLKQGIAARSSAAATAVVVLGPSPPGLRCRLFAAQEWAARRTLEFAGSAPNQHLPIFARLRTADALMLNAMLFGDRNGLSHNLRVGFERTGSFHLFVVSGLHIGLVAGGVFWILTRLRAPSWLSVLMTLGLALAYAALTGFGEPTQRALGMTAVFLAASLFARNREPLNALGAAVLVMLVWSPQSLFDTSFQMTVLAIVAILGMAVPLGERTVLRHARVTREVFKRPRRHFAPAAAQLRLMLEMWGEAFGAIFGRPARRLPAFATRLVLGVGELALIGLVAELVMVLPMAIYFHRAAVFALPANMLVIPVIAVLVPAAVATFVLALVSPWMALAPGAATAVLLHAMTFAIGLISRFQVADVRVPGPAWYVSCVALAAWGVGCWAVRHSG